MDDSDTSRRSEIPAMEMEVEEEECKVKQVDMTVPKTDDPTIPAVTFRMWILGMASCIILSFVNQFFWYRSNPMSVSSIAAMIAVVPLGHLMAKTLPDKKVFEGTKWESSLNPGPFNMKEHVLITIFANSGAGSVYAAHILSAVRLFYKRSLGFLPALIVMGTTQVLGFGWAGIFRKYLVEPGEMWWPGNLVTVSLFRALHDKDKRPKGGTTLNQFFVIVLITSFAYFVFPGYLMQVITSISWICWLAPKSVLIQQLGSGSNGMGLGSFAIDWATISSFLGSPLASPWFASANVAAGFFIVMYIMLPVTYWLDVYKAKSFPIISKDLFMGNGETYDILSIVDKNFHLDRRVYAEKGPVYLSTFFAMTYGFGFATISATIVHVLLFDGREIWRTSKEAFLGSSKMDIHTKLMKKYKSVPMWWFYLILVVNIALIIFTMEYYKESLQLPWWGVLLACGIAILFTLPIGIITATTNQAPGLNIITEYVIGYMYPESPVANMCFKVYGYISMTQALTFLSDFKLGHYMKIPPRSMFMAQVVGTIVSVLVYTLTAWWLMESIPHLCDTAALPKDSQWKCPSDAVFFDASVIWGLVGPRRIFGDLGVYGKINWFFLGGAISPCIVWAAHKMFPGQKWIRLIHLPVLFGATAMMPPASAVNYTSWLIVAFVSGFVVFRRRPEWWKRYNYVLSGGLDAGTAFATVFMFLALKSKPVSWWGNEPDGCPLASCPTAKGVIADGCPAY